ncbi:MAG: T9SS type A sorting domain-containing protein [Bacteroidales bacterium]|nr:T9SS type A sorting domain-containing protein [Bacteroidales bacterium]
MRNLLLLIALAITLSLPLTAQEVHSPKIVRKAAYADKTPPLRDMKIIVPGERKRAWKDGVIGNKSVKMIPEPPENAATAMYNDLQESMGPMSSRGPIVSIPGIGNVNGVYPPDTDGAVGPNHYFQMINLSFAIWDKQGTKLYGPVDNSTLWEGFIGPWTGSNDGDPIVLYDVNADRFVASQFAVERPNGKSYQVVAVSATGDPLGEYYRYAFEFDDFNDYPKMSTWHDGYYCSFNFFGDGFIGGGVAAFERDKMLVGDPDARMIFFGYFEDKYSLLPSDVDGQMPPSDAPNYIATMNAFSSRQFEIYEFKADWDNPENSTYQLGVSINPGFFNPSIDGIPQPGTSGTLDALSQMLMYRLPYRNFGTYESMVANHTVNVSGRAGIRWYEFRKQPGGAWSIYQQGVYAPNDGLHRWMGSIAMNAAGTIALGYSVSGSSDVYPSIRYTGRPADAPLGQMTYDEVEATTGFGTQTQFSRWGDYSCMNVDPVYDSVFWFTQEYMNFSWKTRIVAFDFGPVQLPEVYAGPDGYVCQDTFYYVNGSAQYAQSWQWTTSGDGFFITPNNLYSPYLRGSQDLANGHVYLKLTAQGYGQGLFVSDSLLLNITYRPTVHAGNDTTIHTSAVYLTNPQVVNYSAVYWTTSGDGVFGNPTDLQTIYTPGTGDITAGMVKLTLDAAPLSPCSFGKTDDMMLFLDASVSIGEPVVKPMMMITPNPTEGAFDILLNGFKKDGEIQVYNMDGAVIFTEKIDLGRMSTNPTRSFDFRYMPKGIYLVKINSGSQTQSEKVIIQ